MIFKETQNIYLQIANRICEEILMERHKEEERIPSVREYAALIEVNINTILKAYDYLQNQNVIFNKRGLGYFVSLGAKKNIQQQRKKFFLEETLPALVQEMKLLSIDIDEVLLHYNHLTTTL